MNRFALLLIAVCLASLLSACGVDSRADGNAPEPRHRVAVQRVDWQDGYSVQRSFAGRVESAQSPTVAFELPGRIAELLVDEGEAVAAGAPLARLDTRLLQAETDELRARAEEIEADLDLARRNLARVQRLQADQLASERERDELASRVRLLEASRGRNRAALDANRIRLEKTILRAPFPARVTGRAADAGAVVAAGEPVFTLVGNQRREVRAGLPRRLAADLRIGDRLAVRVGNDRAHGEVLAIGAVVDLSTGSQPVRLAVNRDWAPGDLAYLEVGETVPDAGAWLPDTAVTEGLRGTWVVYVARADGDGEAVLESRSVTIRHAAGGRLFVTGALEDGEQVVTEGLHRVAPGQRVRTHAANRVSHVHAGA